MSEIDDALKFDPVAIKKKEEAEDEEMSAALEFDPSPGVAASTGLSVKDDQPELSWGEAMSTGLGNIPESAGKELGALAEAVKHPIRAAGTLYSLSKGVVKLGLLKSMATLSSEDMGKQYDKILQEDRASGMDSEIEMADQVFKYFSDYVDPKELKNRIANDPVAVLMDVLSVAVPATKAVGLERTSRVLRLADPVTGAMKAVTQPLRLIPAHIPQDMYRRAVGFANKTNVRTQRKLADTAMDNLVVADARGMLKLENKLNDLNEVANNVIDTATNEGRFVSFEDFYRGLDDLKQDAIRKADASSLNQVRSAFTTVENNITKMLEDQGPLRTLREAQDMKSEIYRSIQNTYDTLNHVPAAKNIRKLAARNAKTLLEEAIPEIKNVRKLSKSTVTKGGLGELNIVRKNLIDLEQAIQTRAMALDRSKIFGMGVLVSSGFGGAAGYQLGQFLGEGARGASIGSGIGLSYGIITSPRVQQKAATLINSMRKSGITLSPTLTAMELGLYQGQKATERSGAE